MALDPTAYSATLQPLRYSEPGDVIIKRRLPPPGEYEEVALATKVDGFPVMDASGQMATLTLAEMQAKIGAQTPLDTSSPAPSNQSSTGTKGERRYVSGFIYECIATDTWIRYAAATTFTS